jgi:hypothetical protein
MSGNAGGGRGPLRISTRQFGRSAKRLTEARLVGMMSCGEELPRRCDHGGEAHHAMHR